MFALCVAILMDCLICPNMNPLQRSQSESVFILACAGVVALQVVELLKTLEPSMSFFGQACYCDWLI